MKVCESHFALVVHHRLDFLEQLHRGVPLEKFLLEHDQLDVIMITIFLRCDEI